MECCKTQQDALKKCIKHYTTEHGAAELNVVLLNSAQNTQHKPTRIDKTEERAVGGQAAVPLKSPIGATTRPLDGQNLWLQWALSGGTIGKIITFLIPNLIHK